MQIEGDGNCQVGYKISSTFLDFNYYLDVKYFIHGVWFYMGSSDVFVGEQFRLLEFIVLLIYIISLAESVIIFQFRALADQIYQNPDFHKFVRKEVIKQVSSGLNFISTFRSKFQIFISQNFYLVNLSSYIQVLVLFSMQVSSGKSLI